MVMRRGPWLWGGGHSHMYPSEVHGTNTTS